MPLSPRALIELHNEQDEEIKGHSESMKKILQLYRKKPLADEAPDSMKAMNITDESGTGDPDLTGNSGASLGSDTGGSNIVQEMSRQFE